jgi:hypothetical protein
LTVAARATGPDAGTSDVVVAGSGAKRVDIPVAGPPFERAPSEALEAFRDVSAATAAQTLHKMGLSRAYMQGPRALDPDYRAVGSALSRAIFCSHCSQSASLVSSKVCPQK